MSLRLHTTVVLAIFASLAITGSAYGQDTVVVTLARAEQLALQNHPTAEGARLDVAVSETRRRQARNARYVPRFTLRNVWGTVPRARGEFTDTGVLISPDTMTSFSDLRWFTQVDVDIIQPLYTFGRIGGLIDAAEAGLEASRAGVDAATADVRLQVRQMYWGVVLGEELLEVAEDVLGKLAEADSTLNERYEEGFASQNDLFKLDLFEYQVRKRHREARDRLTMARAGLRATIGVDPDVPIRVASEELSPVEVNLGRVNQYLTLAFANRPELHQLQAGIEARHSLVRSKQGERWPQLFLAAQIKWNRAPDRFDPRNPFVNNPTNFFRPGVVVGFNWNANIFQSRNETQLAEYEAARLSSQLDPLTQKIGLDVRQAYLDVVRAKEDVDDSQRALTTSENWYRAESQTFDMGLSEIPDLVDAFKANVEMRTEHLRAVFVYNTAMAKLSQATGSDIYSGGS